MRRTKQRGPAKVGSRRWVGAAAAAAALALVGCGGGGGGQCGGNTSCGGNLVGTWDITGTCVGDGTVMATASCPNVATDSSGLHETGTLTFNADHTYSGTFALSGSFVETYPTSCLSADGLSCDQLNLGIQAGVTSGDIASGSCVSVSSGCTCTIQFVSTTMAAGGTYATNGGSLTITDTGQAPDDASYCVQGSVLTVTSSSMSGTSMMAGVLTQITLMKH